MYLIFILLWASELQYFVLFDISMRWFIYLRPELSFFSHMYCQFIYLDEIKAGYIGFSQHIFHRLPNDLRAVLRPVQTFRRTTLNTERTYVRSADSKDSNRSVSFAVHHQHYQAESLLIHKNYFWSLNCFESFESLIRDIGMKITKRNHRILWRIDLNQHNLDRHITWFCSAHLHFFERFLLLFGEIAILQLRRSTRMM